MGYKEVTVKLPTDYTEATLREKVKRELGVKDFTCHIEHKSLDARKKTNIHWLVKVLVVSEELKGGMAPVFAELEIPYQKRKARVHVVGSGPAGFFCALVLQKAGFNTTLIERGSEVEKRGRSISQFEQKGIFDPLNNYAFGEGGAGTFSDGKLTSRSKHISQERQFVLSSYVGAGAPAEILYLAHPHLGTDNLKIIVKNLRQEFLELGGTMLFETMLEDVTLEQGCVTEVKTSRGTMPTDGLFIASGHSAYETYRMLMRSGMVFQTKNFAIGSRMEHPQEIINQAQWGSKKLAGVKAAEYRLTSPGDGKHHVFSFCMCPGGMVVPATAYEGSNIVNGMSYYQRDGLFANAACVAGIHPDELAGKTCSPQEALDRLEQLEQRFYDFSSGFQAPACSISDFINKKERGRKMESSFPLGLKPAPLWDLLPVGLSEAIGKGLMDFSKKMKGFEQGILLGLESKTSSPIRAIREANGRCVNFENLYMMGEGSGYAGGIISSAADGIKAAMHFIQGA